MKRGREDDPSILALDDPENLLNALCDFLRCWKQAEPPCHRNGLSKKLPGLWKSITIEPQNNGDKISILLVNSWCNTHL